MSAQRWCRSAKGVVALLAAGLLATSCFLVRETVNDSPSIRWFLFSNFGASRICPEMLKRGAPLRLGAQDAIAGRFFPSQCQSSVDDATQTLTLHFAGSGYAWTPVAGRLGFSCTLKVEYRPDFFMAEDALYVWARTNRIVQGPDFAISSIENPVVDWAAQGPAGYLAQTFGQQIITSKVAEGFTVVRTDSGDDFAMGILQPPQRPRHPFNTSDNNYVIANDAADVRVGQADFIGPIEVADEDQMVLLRWRAAGTRSDALVYARGVADPMRLTYEQGGGIVPPAVPPLAQWVLEVGETTHRLKLPPGQYMLVVDNSDRLGQVTPPWNPLAGMGSGALSFSYIIELADE